MPTVVWTHHLSYLAACFNQCSRLSARAKPFERYTHAAKCADETFIGTILLRLSCFVAIGRDAIVENRCTNRATDERRPLVEATQIQLRHCALCTLTWREKTSITDWKRMSSIISISRHSCENSSTSVVHLICGFFSVASSHNHTRTQVCL